MRLGAAYAEIHETTLAYATLTKAALVEPSNADIRAKLEVLKQKKEESKKADKSMYYGMFSRSWYHTTPPFSRRVGSSTSIYLLLLL